MSRTYVNLVPGGPVFDPYPFSFLTFVVSLEAIIQENTKTLEMLHRICQHLGRAITADDEVHGLRERTDVDRLARDLAEQ